MKLWQKVVIALIAGVLFGFLMNVHGPLQIDGKEWLKTYLQPFGDTFIDLIKMVVIPLIFFSLISGVTSMSDQGAFKRIGTKAVIAFLSTAAFAVVMGLVFGTLFHPGNGVNLNELLKNASAPKTAAAKDFSLATLLSDIVPNNVISAMGNNDHILQVVVFAIFTAVTINALGEKARLIREFCQAAAQVIFRMIQSIMNLSPYGVFAIVASLVASQGLGILLDLAVLTLVRHYRTVPAICSVRRDAGLHRPAVAVSVL